MSDPLYRNFERLVEITIMGKTFKVPEKNTVLRVFQYVSPETIPYGRFCWNQECQLCKIRMPNTRPGRRNSSASPRVQTDRC